MAKKMNNAAVRADTGTCVRCSHPFGKYDKCGYCGVGRDTKVKKP